MADDPTSTGPEESRPPEQLPEGELPAGVAEFINRILGAYVASNSPPDAEQARIWGQQFRAEFGGDYAVMASDRTYQFSILIHPPGGPREMVQSGVVPPFHRFQLPRALVSQPDPEQLFQIISNNFNKHIQRHLGEETMLFFTTLVNFVVLDQNPGLAGGASRERIIRNHVTRTEAMLRQFFKVKPQTRGRVSPWTAFELTAAVRIAAGQLAEITKNITAEKVAKRMRKLYPEKAPPSGKALLALLRRHGLAWADVLPDEKR